MNQLQILTLLFIVFLAYSGRSQIDYQPIRNHFIATCGSMDSVDLMRNVHFVDSVANLEVTENKEQFLMDYAWAYYRKYLFSTKHSDLLVAINCYHQSWEEFGNTQALFSVASNYAGFNCNLSKRYFNLFEKTMQERAIEIDAYKASQIELIREALCPE